jgi:hypothetical protein
MQGRHVVIALLGFLVLTGLAIFLIVRSPQARSATTVPVRPIAFENLPEADGPAAKLYAVRCVGCHALPDPGQHNAAEWPAVLWRMSSYALARPMQRVSAPTPEESELLLEYLKAHAAPVVAH